MRAPVVIAIGLCVVAASGEAQERARWTLSERPVLTLGVVDGPPEFEFHDIEGVVALGDTLIVVANGGTRQVRVFGGSGEFLTQFGRRGDGPREFRGIGWIDDCGSSQIVAYDFNRHRITKWDPSGTLLDEFQVEGTDPVLPPYSVDCGPDGRYAVVGWPDFRTYSGEIGPYRLDVSVGIVGSKGGLERAIGIFPGPERYRLSQYNDAPRPLGRQTIVRMGERGVYVGTGDSYRIVRIGEDGARQVFDGFAPPIPFTEDLRAVWRDSILDGAPPGMRSTWEKSLREREMPDTLPVYSDFMLDELGYLWVERYGVPGQRIVDWDVFHPEGRLVATVAFPRRFRPMEIGADYVIGVGTTELDVQLVRRYGLTR